MGMDIKYKLLYGAMYDDINLEELEERVDDGALD